MSFLGRSSLDERKKKKLFRAFVDFEKAFDTVWRDAPLPHSHITVKIIRFTIIIGYT
jgi:hypothetical protein